MLARDEASLSPHWWSGQCWEGEPKSGSEACVARQSNELVDDIRCCFVSPHQEDASGGV